MIITLEIRGKTVKADIDIVETLDEDKNESEEKIET